MVGIGIWQEPRTPRIDIVIMNNQGTNKINLMKEPGTGPDRQIWLISQFPKSPYLQLSSIANHTLPFWPSAKKAVDGKNWTLPFKIL